MISVLRKISSQVELMLFSCRYFEFHTQNSPYKTTSGSLTRTTLQLFFCFNIIKYGIFGLSLRGSGVKKKEESTRSSSDKWTQLLYQGYPCHDLLQTSVPLF